MHLIVLSYALCKFLVFFFRATAHPVADLLEQGNQIGIQKVLLEQQFAAFSFRGFVANLHTNQNGVVLIVGRNSSVPCSKLLGLINPYSNERLRNAILCLNPVTITGLRYYSRTAPGPYRLPLPAGQSVA